MKVVIINGHAGCGKSTFIDLCRKHPKADVYEFSMVDAAKTMAKVVGWTEKQKSPKDRKFLSDLKDLIDKYNDGSFEYLKFLLHNYVYSHDLDKEVVVFINAREAADIKRLCDTFNAKSLVIRRKEVESIPASNHADANWWNYSYDYAVDNNDGLEFLEKNSQNFIDFILKEDWEYDQESEE